MSVATEFMNAGETTFFAIPEELINKVPCQLNPSLYEDPALDIDLDEMDWLALSGDDQRARLASKAAAEQRAVAACNTCPLLESCRDWAMNSGVEIFGVVGGTTPEERNSAPNRRIIGDPGVSRISKSERDEIILELMESDIPNKAIAERLGCSVRTIERRKAYLRAAGRVSNQIVEPVEIINTADQLLQNYSEVQPVERSKDEATNDLIPSRVTSETAAIFDALSDGSVKSRNALVESLVSKVSREQALAAAPKDRDYESEEAQINAGARKFIMNRLDIAVRRGRVQFLKTGTNEILVHLEPRTNSIWNAYRANSYNAPAA